MFKRYFLAVYLCFSMLLPTMAAAQVEVGNGGDIVHCRDEDGMEFKGYYFLDYLVTYSANKTYHSGNDPLMEIVNYVEERDLALGANLRDFVTQARLQIFGSPDRTHRFQWQRNDNGVATLSDEDLRFLPERFPSNCLAAGSDKKLELLQIVFHSERSDGIHLYRFDGMHLGRIEQDARQFSFMIIHEWLWQFAREAYVVRDANLFLQTDELLGTDATDFRRALTNMGLNLSSVPSETGAGVSKSLYKSPEGRLRVLKDGLWKGVCGSRFDEVDGRVACFQLGKPFLDFREDEDQTFSGLGDWKCSGNESKFEECVATDVCKGYPVVLRCDETSNGKVGDLVRSDIRLTGPHRILEVKDRGEWAGVCDDGFDANAGIVACRQLGGTYVVHQADLPGRSEDYGIDDLVCNGSETSLFQCARSSGSDNCSGTEHISLVCDFPSSPVHVSGDLRLNQHILEVFHWNEWRAVCDDVLYDSSNVMQAACAELGGGTPEWEVVTRESVRFWPMSVGECADGAKGLYGCQYNPWGRQLSCNKFEHISLQCR
jgi:hypothetical protein